MKIQNRFQVLEELLEVSIGGVESEVYVETAYQNREKLKPAGKGRITIDSGVAESVLLVGMLPGEEMVEGESKRKGVRYVAANGGKMENHGEKRVRFRRNGSDAVNSITFQVTGVSKPLASVSRIPDKGNTVVFSRSGEGRTYGTRRRAKRCRSSRTRGRSSLMWSSSSLRVSAGRAGDVLDASR